MLSRKRIAEGYACIYNCQQLPWQKTLKINSLSVLFFHVCSTLLRVNLITATFIVKIGGQGACNRYVAGCGSSDYL